MENGSDHDSITISPFKQKATFHKSKQQQQNGVRVQLHSCCVFTIIDGELEIDGFWFKFSRSSITVLWATLVACCDSLKCTRIRVSPGC